MENFRVPSGKIYTGLKKFTQAPPVAPVTNIRYDLGYFLGISWGYLGDIFGPFVHWSIGPLEHWSIGALVHWSIGPFVHWSIGPLVHWSIGSLRPLDYWSMGPLVLWTIKVKLLSERTSEVTPVIFRCVGNLFILATMVCNPL